jgi:hypothetical protein
VFVLDSHHFVRDALFDQLESDPTAYWHRPIIIRDPQTKLGDVIGRLKVSPERPDDDDIDNDLILVWGPSRPTSARWCWTRPRRRLLGPGVTCWAILCYEEQQGGRDEQELSSYRFPAS